MESDQDNLDHGPDDRDKDIDTQVPDAAVINMKANFVLPEVTDLPSQVAFLDFFLSIFFENFSSGGGGFLFNCCLHRAGPTGDSNDCLPGVTKNC